MKKEPLLLCPDHFQFALEKLMTDLDDIHDAFMGYQKYLFSGSPTNTKKKIKAKKRTKVKK